MVLIVKRFVPVYDKKANVPKKYKNLLKSIHLKTFSRPFPNIPEILVNEYGMNYEDKILVFHTKTIDRRDWKNYRTPFKKVYYGTVRDFGDYLRRFLLKIRKRNRI